MPLKSYRTAEATKRPVPGLYLVNGAVALVTRYKGAPNFPGSVQTTHQATVLESKGDDVGNVIYLTEKSFDQLTPFNGAFTLQNQS